MYKQSIVPYNEWGWRLVLSLDTEDVTQFIMSNSLLEDVVNDQLLSIMKQIMGKYMLISLNFNLHERWLFCTSYMKVNHVKRIVLESQSEMCKWFILKMLFPIHFCSEWFQYEEQYAIYYVN